MGGAALFSGYAWALIKRVEKPVSQELVVFRRKEQRHRLKEFLSKNVFLLKSD